MEVIYEGKEKFLYRTQDPSLYRIRYKDTDYLEPNLEDKPWNKALIKNQMTGILFDIFEKNGIPTHFVKLLNTKEQLVKAVKMLPLEVIIRNTVAGALSKRLGIKIGTEIKRPILELCYKNDEFDDPFINEDHAISLEFATSEQIDKMKYYAIKINKILTDYFLDKGIRLIDFKLEFGIIGAEVVLADEISTDKCRLWYSNTCQKIDLIEFHNNMNYIYDFC